MTAFFSTRRNPGPALKPGATYPPQIVLENFQHDPLAIPLAVPLPPLVYFREFL